MVRALYAAATLLVVVVYPVAGQTVHGRVVDDATGAPLGLVSIELLDAAGERQAQVESDSAGTFTLRAPSAGAWTLRLSRIGYQEVRTSAVEVAFRERVQLELRMSPAAVPLEPLRVVARAEFLPIRVREFRERAEWVRGSGFGRVFMRDDLERMNIPRPSGLMGYSMRRGCDSVTIMLDGLPLTNARELDSSIQISSLEGAEFYTGTQMPQEYQNRGYCAIAMFWSRADAPGARPLTLGRAFAGLAIIVGGFLIMVR